MSEYKHRMSLAVPQAFADMGLMIVETGEVYMLTSDLKNL